MDSKDELICQDSDWITIEEVVSGQRATPDAVMVGADPGSNEPWRPGTATAPADAQHVEESRRVSRRSGWFRLFGT